MVFCAACGLVLLGADFMFLTRSLDASFAMRLISAVCGPDQGKPLPQTLRHERGSRSSVRETGRKLRSWTRPWQARPGPTHF